MITFNSITELTNTRLRVGDLVRALGESNLGDRAPMIGIVRALGHNTTNRKVNITQDMFVEIMPDDLPQYNTSSFNTVEDMKANAVSVTGAVYHTLGYHTVGDGGGALYVNKGPLSTEPNGKADHKSTLGDFLELQDRQNPLAHGMKKDTTKSIDQTELFDAAVSDATDKGYTLKFPSGDFALRRMNLRSKNLIGLRGEGMEKTSFWALGDIAATEAFMDCGVNGSDFSTPDSDIQFADIGDFSIRANGKNVENGVAFNNFRRSKVSNIRVFDAMNSFKYSFCWLNDFSGMFSENHKVSGHTITGDSTNALGMGRLVASSNVSGSVGYKIENPYTVTLYNPDCEGNGHQYGFDITNGRQFSVVNPHIEGPGSKFKMRTTSTNGLTVNIIGGGAFGCPEAIDFSSSLQMLNISGFGIHKVGVDFSALKIRVNAKVAIINIAAYNNAKQAATQQQLIDALEIGSNVETLILNGQDVVSKHVTYSGAVTVTAATAADIPTSDIKTRSTVEVLISQRLNSTQVASAKFVGTVNDAGALTVVKAYSVNDSSADFAIGFNSTSGKLTVSAKYAGSIKYKVDVL